MVYKWLYAEAGLFLWLLAFHMLLDEDCNMWVFCDVLSSDSTFYIPVYLLYVCIYFFLTCLICVLANYSLKMLFEYSLFWLIDSCSMGHVESV